MGKFLKTKDLKFAPLEEDIYSRFLRKEISQEDKKRILELYPQLLI